jgi:hypothetical protein
LEDNMIHDINYMARIWRMFDAPELEADNDNG